jgi:hypothetical protein
MDADTLTVAFMMVTFAVLLWAVFCAKKYYGLEGFGTFNHSLVTGEQVIVTPYDSTKRLVKLFDTLYIDPSNRVMLDIHSAPSDTTTPPANNGALEITQIDQTGKQTLLPVTDSKVSVSTVVTFDATSTQSFVYTSPYTQLMGTGTFSYVVTYMNRGPVTLLYVMGKQMRGANPSATADTPPVPTPTTIASVGLFMITSTGQLEMVEFQQGKAEVFAVGTDISAMTTLKNAHGELPLSASSSPLMAVPSSTMVVVGPNVSFQKLSDYLLYHPSSGAMGIIVNRDIPVKEVATSETTTSYMEAVFFV